jgi:hypothetical protein
VTDEFEELPEHEPAWAALDRITKYRKRLLAAGYQPVLLNGKKPLLDDWPNIVATDNIINKWAQDYPDKWNTGIQTRTTPALDIDVTDEEAAEELEALAEDIIGKSAVRIGQAPKRAIVFRTDTPFDKLTAKFVAPNGAAHRIEIMGDGQQIVVDGIHPDTGQPYHWHGGEPGPELKRDDLLLLTAEKAAEYVAAATKLLIARGWRLDEGRKKKSKGNGTGAGDKPKPGVRERAWAEAALDSLANELAATKEPGRNDKLYKCAFRMGTMIARGWIGRDEVETALYGAALACGLVNDDGEAQTRRSIDSGLEGGIGEPHHDLPDDGVVNAKKEAPPQFTGTTNIDLVLEKFVEWLLLSDTIPIYAMLGTVAANLLEGDPVWLGLIGPPSSAKTELLNSTAKLPHVVQAATVTPAGLLSGTPKKQVDKGAKGGLLRHIGDFGIIVLKDFGSILSMRADAKAEILAALREVFDGAWTRHLGTDGGRTLSWRGKVGLLFGATGVIDAHYSVIGAMGDRFLLCRLAPTPEGQFSRALEHLGAKTKQMRAELAEAVAHLFACRNSTPRKITEDEVKRIDRAISLVVRLRGAVERDRVSREVEAVYGAEGTARIGLALERLLAGLDTLGVDRATALTVVESVAMDSVPPLRRRAYEYLCSRRFPATDKYEAVPTPDIAAALDLPTNTVRRALEDLAAYQLVKRQKDGYVDLWTARPA